jgi:hypothetical protein
MEFRMEDIIKPQRCQMLSVACCEVRVTSCGVRVAWFGLCVACLLPRLNASKAHKSVLLLFSEKFNGVETPWYLYPWAVN